MLKFIFLSLLLSFGISVLSQNGIVRGTVQDADNGQPIIFTNVYLKGTNIGAVTDVDGIFVMTKVPVGTYSLMVTFVGYDTLIIPIKVEADKILTKKLQIRKGAFELTGTVISGERIASKQDPKTSVIKVTPKDIKALPSIGQADIAQYIQVIPGVVFTGDQGGQLYIRGGTPIQNLVLLDGMTVYNPFHSVGLFSVFDADILRNADVYTGGFGAEYGGRISSVMDITTRYGNTKRLSGKVDVSTFGAKVLVEGPIIKSDSLSDGTLSYIFSYKNSYLDKTSKTIYSYVNDKEGLPFTFSDLYGKVSFNASKGTKAEVFGFNFTDAVNYKTINKYKWSNNGLGLKFVVVPEGSTMIMDGSISGSNYNISLDDGSSAERVSDVTGVNAGLGATYFIGKNRLKFGFEIKGFTTDYIFHNSLNRQISQKESTSEVAGYAAVKLFFGKSRASKDTLKMNGDNNEKFAKLIIVPGFRLHYYATLDNISPEPRISVKYNLTKDFRFKMAAGLYSQNIISTASDRDVINLFYGYLSGPENLQNDFEGEELTHKLQKATHLIFGSEWDLNDFVSLNLEGYYKWFTQLTNLNRNKVFDDNAEYSDRPDILKKDFIIEKGDAYGFDASMKLDYKSFYFWAVYSLGYSHRNDGITEYVPHFDRRHNVNLVASYDLDKKKSWQISARWNFGSGFPFTPTLGNYELITFQNGIGTDYTTTNGQIGTIYGDINSKRLPSYHRLDISMIKKFYFTETSILEFNFSITNIYNRSNIFYIDRITNERVDQLPLMPSIGLSFNF